MRYNRLKDVGDENYVITNKKRSVEMTNEYINKSGKSKNKMVLSAK